MPEDTEQLPAATDIHFCVFVHGLWGNPGHLAQISKALQTEFEDRGLHLLVAKRNIGNFTYDGIELGGERVTKEIEDEIEELGNAGKNITKISVVGYSLGGLIARYAIGLLFSRGYFERMQPTNFTCFATPHLGTRTPLLGWANQVFNNLGSRTLSASGQQLWCTDNFQETGRPILSVLADPHSIFVRALSRFKHRILYANVVNDRAVPFYTACIEDIDPFIDLDALKINYTPDWEDVILQHPMGESPHTEAMAAKRTETPTYGEAFANGARNALNKAPLYLFLGTLAPIGATVFLANAGIQSFKSATRIQEHAEGKGGIEKGRYKVQLMIEQAQRQAEKMMGELTAKDGQEYLKDADEHKKPEGGQTCPAGKKQTSTEDEDPTMQVLEERKSIAESARRINSNEPQSPPKDDQPTPNGYPQPPKSTPTTSVDDALAYGEDHHPPSNAPAGATGAAASALTPPADHLLSYPASLSSKKDDDKDGPDFPTLALTPEQFKMKESLDAVGWKKYPVHIKKANHSHAAIIVRMQRPGFGEGRTVARHWVERFEI